MSLLEVEDLRVRFTARRGLLGRPGPTVHAVEGVSFVLGAGKTLGLVGESGCGKSTTARAILRLVDIHSGRVRLDGVDVARLKGGALKGARRKMQMIFQDPYASLDPRMTVLDIVAEPLFTHRLVTSQSEARRRVTALLEQVGLSASHMRRYPHEFSGGQRQRVGIARAIALEPALVIADEPVSALDMSIRAQILNLLIDLQRRRNMAYLLIAHDLAVVRHAADAVIVMYLGRIVEHASTGTLFERPQHPYTQALLSAVPLPDPERERARKHLVLVGDVPSPLSPPSGCAFHTRCPYVFDRCRVEAPPLEDRGIGHLVACHLAEPPELPHTHGSTSHGIA
jgi:oligopeptide/dipeptide ABC transporter ATP-binding protein